MLDSTNFNGEQFFCSKCKKFCKQTNTQPTSVNLGSGLVEICTVCKAKLTKETINWIVKNSY